MGTEKKKNVFLESPVWLFFSEYERRRDKKVGKLHFLDCRTLKRNYYFWPSIAQLILANSCAYCRQLRKSLFSGNKQSRDKDIHFQCQMSCKVCPMQSLPAHFSELAASARCFLRGHKQELNLQLRTFLVKFGLQKFVFSILKGTIWKWYIMPKKLLLPSSYLWTNVKSTSHF